MQAITQHLDASPVARHLAALSGDEWDDVLFLKDFQQTKQLKRGDLEHFRAQFGLPLTDEVLENLTLFNPGDDSVEVQYMKQHRSALGGFLPQRRRHAPTVNAACRMCTPCTMQIPAIEWARTGRAWCHRGTAS
ncbi:MAG: hypothetical protein NZ847_12280 [Acidobacteria bacterium]|nr:hypothetical protein [Acidobacteriota bacterium]